VTDKHVAIIPVGKIKGDELEHALVRVAKTLRQPIELKGSVPVPKGAEDPERGQHRAADLLTRLRASVLQLPAGKLLGGAEADEKPPSKPGAMVFVTDVDLYTAKTDGVFGALVTAKLVAITSVRRLREAFYRRPADLGKQRSRLVRELLRMIGRLRGLPACTDPQCVVAPTRSVADLDTKSEHYCRACAQRLFEGKIQI